jgi:AraC family transcriptional regulator
MPEREQMFVNPEFSVKHASNAPVGPHAHFEHTISYYFSGFCGCRIGVQTLEFQTGNIALINAGELHEDVLPKQMDYLMVGLKKEFIMGLLREIGCAADELPHFSAPKLGGDSQIKAICEELLSESDGRQLGREVLLRSVVTELAIYLLRHFVALNKVNLPKVHKDNGMPAHVMKAMEYLQDTFTESFDLERVSAAADLSKYHLDRVFKRATGLRPHTYVAMLRVERAKTILALTSKPIADIALELGFADQSHFSNVFKQLSGLSPRAYRMATARASSNDGIDFPAEDR